MLIRVAGHAPKLPTQRRVLATLGPSVHPLGPTLLARFLIG